MAFVVIYQSVNTKFKLSRTTGSVFILVSKFPVGLRSLRATPLGSELKMRIRQPQPSVLDLFFTSYVLFTALGFQTDSNLILK